MTGNPRATNPLVINPDGKANLKIPHNGGAGLGYAMWGPKSLRGSTTVEPFSIAPVQSVIPPDGSDKPNGVRRITPIERITADRATLTLTLEDEGLDDKALVRIDDGSVNIIGTEVIRGGEFVGFQGLTNVDPAVTGRGLYSARLDISQLSNGMHYLEAIAFLKRDSGLPPIFATFRKVIIVER